MGSSRPDARIGGCMVAHARLGALVDRLSDDVRRSALLEGWTVGHVLTHLARNADSHVRIVRAAQRGEMVPQYRRRGRGAGPRHPGGRRRPAAALVEDVPDLAAGARGGLGDGRRRDLGDRLRPAAPGAGQPGRLRVLPLARGRAAPGRHGAGGPRRSDLGRPERRLPRPGVGQYGGRAGLAGAGAATLLLVPGDRPSRAVGGGPERHVIRAEPRRILRWLGRGEEPDWPKLGPWFSERGADDQAWATANGSCFT